jgi:hypothetical protein
MAMAPICPECSEALYFFEPQPSLKSVVSADLPAACRGCHGIFLHGVRLQLPAAFEQKAVSLAVQADTAARSTRAEMDKDPELKVASYMTELYKGAYMTGFFRAMAYFQHQAKEGRLIRLSRLWRAFVKVQPRINLRGEVENYYSVRLSHAEYTEFDKLLQVRTTKESDHVQGAANGDASRGAGEAPVQGPKGSKGGGQGPVQ